ncbi:WXG100 family type VII secretion target [Anaerosporobacter faecicola]|uniref:WXG100 family type VII secretion target n=1 Tax=Anaerosporobacter faecicola TaxID=2718714 RepID=UPI00143CB6F9|nr:WXG100 family type VII secretion target [Anaerosporobacter faecicola]
MYDLKVDTAAIQTAITEYETIYKEIDTLKEDLTKTIEDLKAVYWQSEGGEAFFKKYDDSWAKNVDVYLKVLEFLKTELGYAKTEYDSLIQKANELAIGLDS